jgi:HEAT repeat protein
MAPGAPASGAPTAPSGSAPTGGASPSSPTSPAGGPRTPSSLDLLGGGLTDPAHWSHWWAFNREPYLDLKAALERGGLLTGEDSFFLGQLDRAQARDTLLPTTTQVREVVVPALLRALEGETNNDVVTGCLIALARIGPGKDEERNLEVQEAIAGRLTSGNQEISETAALSLGILAHPGAVPLLTALARDTEAGRKAIDRSVVGTRTRAFAAYGLGVVGGRLPTRGEGLRRSIVETLVEVIESDRTSTRDLGVACLTSIGLVPLDAERANPAAPDEAGIASREAQVDWLLAYLADENHDQRLRAHAPTAIARLIRPGGEHELHAAKLEELKASAAPAMLAVIGVGSKSENELRQSCAQALGCLGDNDADDLDVGIRKALVRVPEATVDQQARSFALIALAQLGGRSGNGPEGPGVAEVEAHLLGVLSRGKGTERPWAALALGVLGRELGEEAASRDVARALRLRIAEERTPDRVGAHALGAGLLADREAVPLLLERFAVLRDDKARGDVAVALGMIGEREAVGPIEEVVRASAYRPELLQSGAIALGLLGDKEAVPLLVDQLRRARSLASQAALASALGRIGDGRSIAPLVEMLEAEGLTPTSRAFAAVALGIVADSEPLPWNSRLAVNVNYRAGTGTLVNPQGTGVLNIL